MDFNLRHPLLADRRVREALVRVIDRSEFARIEGGLAVPQYGPLPRIHTWANDDLQRYEPDRARAEELLAEAGLSIQGGVLRDLEGRAVSVEVLWPTTSATRGDIALYLQRQWESLGIETVLTGLELNAFLDRYANRRDFAVSIGSYSGGIDPASLIYGLGSSGSQNATGYGNERVDELFVEGLTEHDHRRRRDVYDRLQAIVVDDLPVYYMVTLNHYTAFDRRVKGVRPTLGSDLLSQGNLQVLDWLVEGD